MKPILISRRRSAFLKGAVLLLLAGAYSVHWSAAGLRGLHEPLSSAWVSPLLVSGCAVFVFLLGLLLLISILLGRPRLRIDDHGVTLETLIKNQKASWSSLSNFRLLRSGNSRIPEVAHATLIGADVSASLKKQNYFEIQDVFEKKLDEVVALLNLQRNLVLREEATRLDSKAERLAAEYKQELLNVGDPNFRRPILCEFIIMILVAIYGLEIYLSHFNTFGGSRDILTPSSPILLMMGALNKTVLLENESWYRLLTAPLLHGSVLHILFNALALYFAGAVLEKLVGKFWFFSLFFLGALGGSFFSFMINGNGISSVGASGGIMALFAATYVLSFRLPIGPARVQMQSQAMRVIVPSLMPLFASVGLHIDYGAHLGGAVTGATLGFLLLKVWAPNERMPRYQGLAENLAILGLLCFLGCSLLAGFHYQEDSKLFSRLIPDNQLPKSKVVSVLEGQDIVAHYPYDPRSHLALALAYIKINDEPSAISELLKSIEESKDYENLLGHFVEYHARFLLALLELEHDHRSEAEKIIEPVCGSIHSGILEPAMIKLLEDHDLCRSITP